MYLRIGTCLEFVLLESLHTRRLHVLFSGEEGPDSHKTVGISASTASSRLRIAVNESCVTNLIRVPR